MNRLGIRLAAGLAVVCLGGLAIFQAQQDKSNQLGDAWPSAADIAAPELPAPLGLSAPVDLSGDWPALPDETDKTIVRGNRFSAEQESGDQASNDPDFGSQAFEVPANGRGFSPTLPTTSSSGVRLASFDQPADETDSDQGLTSGTDDFAPPSFSPPSFSTATAYQPESEPDEYGSGAKRSPNTAPSDSPAGIAPAFNSPSFDTPRLNAAGSPDGPNLRAPQQSGAASSLTLGGPIASFSTEESGSGQETGMDDGDDAADYANDPAPIGSGYQPDSQPRLTPLPTSSDSPQSPPTPMGNSFGQAPATTGSEPIGSEPIGSSPIGSGLAQQPVPAMEQFGQSQPSFTQDPSFNQQPGDAQQPLARVASRSSSGQSMDAPNYRPESPVRLGNQFNSNDPYGSGALPVPTALQTIDKSEILAEPGTRDLEGAQTPSVLVQKRAPAEVRVGKPAQFVIAVKNVGTVPALDVRVFDTVPQGMALEATLPPAENVTDLLVWQLGDMNPGEERQITMTLVPQTEGEVGSVARVTFEAAASVRTVATQPNVQFIQRSPEQVLIGQQMEIDVEVKNTGTGTADNVVVLAELPEGLETSAGRSLKLTIGSMPPGATHRDVLRLRATKAGDLNGKFQVMDSDGPISDASLSVQVISPKLEVALQGPSMRYLERQATYNVQIANTGTADASDIDLIVYLDRGLKFVSTEYQGKYDPTRHAVFWGLEELRANEVGEVPLTLLPVEAGVQKVRVETTGALGLSARSERQLSIETLAELSFSIVDDQDPIEPGAFTTYEIRVKNTGSRDDTNVVLEVQIPHPGLELVTAEPSAGTDGRGKVIFEPIARIPAKGEQIYRIRVKANQADTHIVRATLASAQSKRPVTKEESTTVYQDQ